MRLPDWQLRFADLTKRRVKMPFAWGTHDCCMWASDCVLAITGTDFTAAWRGKYSTELGAAKILLANGGLEAMATATLGEGTYPAMANVGDVMLLDQYGMPMLAVCNGQTMLAPHTTGLAVWNTLSAQKCWKI